MTTAERIANLFGNDGTTRDRYKTQQRGTLYSRRYTVGVRSTLDGECERAGGVYVTDRTNKLARYLFPDASVIIDMESGWDIGYLYCWCCQSIGHSDECRERTHLSIQNATLKGQGISGY